MDVNVNINSALIIVITPSMNVVEGRSISVTLENAPVVGILPSYVNVLTSHTLDLSLSAARINIASIFDKIKIYSIRVPNVSERFRRNAWQARLGKKLDPIRKKILDNQILLTSHPTDMIRIREERDERSQDLKSRTVVSEEVLPVIMPVLEDIPLRHLYREDGEYVMSLSLMEYQKDKGIEVYCPMENQLTRGDLLFRIVRNDSTSVPLFMVMQVKDELGTFSYSSLLYIKYKLSFYDEKIPQKILEILTEKSLKREELGW